MSRVEEILRFVEATHPSLDKRTYYELLGVPKDSAPIVIQQAFYQRAARLHPDRYFKLDDAHTRRKLVEIYARIGEAYKVLADPQKRALYDRGLGEGKTRYVAATEREVKRPVAPEDNVSGREAKRFVKLAFQQLIGGDLKGGLMNLRLALSLEPGSEFIQTQIKQVEAQVAAKQAK